MSEISAPAATARELTVRGIVLGGLITLVFTAANVYLGLKVGLTFATAIPAAVISMSVLRYFKDHSIVENNIVQTIASAAGTLSAIIFVLPGLVMIGWWQGFPYWTTAAVCAIGGTLGVMYSIPLRRALVTGSDLPYPEGVAAAEVLKVGDSSGGAADNRSGVRIISLGAFASAGFSLLSSLKVVGSSVSGALRIGSGGTMFGASLSLALIGVGHLVGLTVGIAMLVGLAISYGVLLPIRTAGNLPADTPLLSAVGSVFSSEVRFIGAGTMAIAAIWTLVKITTPVVKGIQGALVSARERRAGTSVDVTERDIPITWVGIVVVVSLIPIGFLLWDGLTQLDMTGPAQVLSRMPGAQLHYVWTSLDPVMSDCGLALVPTQTLASCPPLDMICVPGGGGVGLARVQDLDPCQHVLAGAGLGGEDADALGRPRVGHAAELRGDGAHELLGEVDLALAGAGRPGP